ncbi:MAG: nuclear transport factor 2 family protein [Anaerolineales bacterium]
MSKLESGMRVVLEFNEAFNRRDFAEMMQLLSDDCVFDETFPAPDGTVITGKEAIGELLQNFMRESPKAHIEVEEIFGMGFRCVMRWRYDWIDAGGKQGHVRGVDIFKLKDGLICEKLSYVKG